MIQERLPFFVASFTVSALLATTVREGSFYGHSAPTSAPDLNEASLRELDRWIGRKAQLIPAELMIFEAEAIEINEQRRVINVRLRITKVLHGPQMQGHSFVASCSPTDAQISGPFMQFPPPQIGEIGIWLVRYRNGRLTALTNGIPGIPFPAREPHTAEYKLALKFATTLDDLARLDRMELMRRLRLLVRGEQPQLAAWAVRQFGNTADQQSSDFLRDLLQEHRLPCIIELAADEVLAKLDNQSWIHSSERSELFQRWASASLSEDDAILTANYLGQMAQARGATELWQEQFLPIVKTGIDNEALPLRARLEFLRVASHFGLKRWRREDGADQPAFEFLIDVLESDRTLDLRLAAAAALKRFSLDAGRRRLTLTELMELADDQQLREILEGVVLSNE